MPLKNKRVCISGASSGIGEACAKQFAERGAKLLLCARRSDKLSALAKALRETYQTDVHTFELDVRDAEAVLKAFNALPVEWQQIDILINNAGLAAGLETIQDADIADWDAMIDTNVKGLMYVTKAVLPNMIARNAGHIINLGSIAGHTVYPKGAVYCASKFAVNAFTQGLRMDLFGYTIRVTTVDPGAVETEFSLVRFKGDAERAKAVYAGMQPLTPHDVANTVLYCVSCPLHVNISEVIIMPTAQASATMVARERIKE